MASDDILAIKPTGLAAGSDIVGGGWEDFIEGPMDCWPSNKSW